jgi:ubiquinone/menaquinone biosynthesis C-methylase UbiE
MVLSTLKALADPVRLRLVAILAHGELTVQELTEILRMGQSRISRHLKILCDAGVLTAKRQGTWGYYRLAGGNAFFADLRPLLEEQLGELPGRQDDLEGLTRILDERRRRTREFFDAHARQWDVLAREVLPTAPYRATLLAAVPSGGCLVEVGVGTGKLLAELRQRAATVIGIDNSAPMLEEAGRQVVLDGLADIDLRLGDMAHLPVPDNGADTAVLNMVLHHAPQPLSVLAEVRRVLRPTGTLIIADFCRHEAEWARERLADQWLGFEVNELSAWLRQAGFSPGQAQLVAGRGTELPVFVLTARKDDTVSASDAEAVPVGISVQKFE